jgi:uncharacterized Zn finger protein (UPF0148 family)
MASFCDLCGFPTSYNGYCANDTCSRRCSHPFTINDGDVICSMVTIQSVIRKEEMENEQNIS